MLLVAGMVLLSGLALVAAPPAGAVVLDPSLQTNGSVLSIARSDSRVFIGGSFTRAGTPTRGGVELSQSSGAPDYTLASPNDDVKAVVPDGAGGWFIGGVFTTVGDAPRNRLAHILADGTLDLGFNPNVDGPVSALVLSGTTLYAGGEFGSVGGATRNRLAAIDTATGLPTAFDAGLSATGAVRALALSGSTLLVGGTPERVVGAVTRKNLVAVDASSGALVGGFDPQADGAVNALALSGSTLYAGGAFTSIAGGSHQRLAALSATTGAAVGSFGAAAADTVNALAVGGGKLFAGGAFSAVNGAVVRNGLAAFGLVDGAVDATFNPDLNGTVQSVAMSGSTVFAAGSFTTVNGFMARNGLAAFSTSTGSATAFDAEVDGSDGSSALAVADTRMYAGGSFTWAGAATKRRSLAAMKLDGTLDTAFGARIDQTGALGNAVDALVLSGGKLYVGGTFLSVNGGVTRGHLAAFDAVTGAVDVNFNPDVNGEVKTLALARGKLYAGGTFVFVNVNSSEAAARNYIAAFDPSSGLVDPVFDPDVNLDVTKIVVVGDKVLAAGQFSAVNINATQVQRISVAAFDGDSGVVDTGFDAHLTGRIADMLLSGDRLYLAGNFGNLGGTPRRGLAAVNPATGALDAGFDAKFSDTTTTNALALAGGTLYAGGVVASSSQVRGMIAALDPATGNADPTFDPGFNQAVTRLFVSGSELYAGGTFQVFGHDDGQRVRRGFAVVGPSVVGTVPDGEATATSVSVRGVATVGSRVRVYGNAACTGAQLASGSAAAFATPGLPVTVPVNATSRLYVTSELGGVTSACSPSFALYSSDQAPPAAPVLTGTVPTSPSSQTLVRVRGMAEPGSTVSLYANAACTGTPLATGSAGAFASSGIPVQVAVGSTTTFRATATDAAGNVSACSSGSVTYTSLAGLVSSDPPSPANQNSPRLIGGAPAGATVRIYPNTTCTGSPAVTGTAADFASPGLTVTVADDSSTTFAVTTEVAGVVSACSTSTLTYVEDSTAPAAPQLTSTVPASPADDGEPEVRGSAEAGSTVRIYTMADCGGDPVVTGTAAALASAGLTAPAPADSVTTFRATATDAAGNVSACSSGLSYSRLATLTATVPASPANDNQPRVKGSASPGATVRLYGNATCTGTPLGTGTGADFAGAGLTITVPDDSTTPLYVATETSGVVSPCSTSTITYIEDSTPPGAPTVTTTSPSSPSNVNDVKVNGTAEAGSTVSLYTDAACSGSAVGTGGAATFAGDGIVAQVPSDATTKLYAKAVDSAQNASPCSASSVTYVEDSTPPAAPMITATNPASPSGENRPRVIGTAEPGSTVKIYVRLSASICDTGVAATGTASEFASPGLLLDANFIANDQTRVLQATATDAAGNTSACADAASTYVEDSTPPAVPTFAGSTPASPANDNAPVLQGTAEAGAKVELFGNAACTGAAVKTGTAAEFASPGFSLSVANDSTTTLYARATDAAQNASVCSAAFTYVEDSTPPPMPTVTGTSPASPANDNAPRVVGTAADGATVKVYTDPACVGPVAASGSAAQFAAGIAIGVADNSTTTWRVTATDAAGNVSGCSLTSAIYIEQTPSGGDTPPGGGGTPPGGGGTTPPPPPPPAGVRDTTAPRVRIAGATRQRLGSTVSVSIACPSEACRITVSGTVRVPRIGRLKARTYRVTGQTKQLKAGNRVTTLKPKISIPARLGVRRALRAKRAITVVLKVKAQDSARNSRSLTRKIKLRL